MKASKRLKRAWKFHNVGCSLRVFACEVADLRFRDVSHPLHRYQVDAREWFENKKRRTR